MSKGIDELAREHAPRAIDILADTMESATEDRDRIRAAEALLDRGYGKPAQAIIQVPANRRQAALLAAMSDEQLVAVIEQKKLPSLAPRQPMVTVSANPRTGEALSRRSSHGPADLYADSAPDPLLA
jgi:hypothetical protein